MAGNPSPDLALTPLTGPVRTVRQLLTTFHLFLVAVDPADPESRAVLAPAARVFSCFHEADVRVAWLVAGDEKRSRRFLGLLADEFLTFVDPDRTAIAGFQLGALPAALHVLPDGTLAGHTAGWQPEEWRTITDRLARMMSWTAPALPGPKDPAPFLPA